MGTHEQEWTVADRFTDWALRARVLPGQHRLDEHADFIITDITVTEGHDGD